MTRGVQGGGQGAYQGWVGRQVPGGWMYLLPGMEIWLLPGPGWPWLTLDGLGGIACRVPL